jgi:hypothetical protein
MYTCCVCFPQLVEPFASAAVNNYSFALKLVKDDLDVSNPFHVLAAIHLNTYTKLTGRGIAGIATGIAMAIGLPDVDEVWRYEVARSVQVTLSINDIYFMWIYMNINDWMDFTLWGLPLRIGEVVDDKFLLEECSNSLQ